MIHIENIYEIIDIIRKKETKEGLTKDEEMTMDRLYNFFKKTSRNSMRYSRKGTRLYDLSLVQYLTTLVPKEELTEQVQHDLNNFYGNQALKFMMDVILKESEKEPLNRFELMKKREIKRQIIKRLQIQYTQSILKDKNFVLSKNAKSFSGPVRFKGKSLDEQILGDNTLEIFNALYNIFEKDLTESEKVDLKLFKVLYDKKNKTVHLSDLYKAVYKGIYEDEEILKRIKDPIEMRKFFEKLNGCLLEETVANIDISRMDPKDFSSIKIDYGTDIDPLVLVKTIKPVPMITITTPPEEEMTFIIISDAHLDQNCYREENGEMVVDQVSLNRNLRAFTEFKKALLKSVEGVKGIVYTGDILDGFFDKNKGKITLRTASNLSGAIVRFEREAKEIEKINKMLVEGGETPLDVTRSSLSTEDPSFVAYLAGNHDMRLGRKKFERVMRLFERSILDPRAVSLGNGSARIKVGEEFISLMHHNSLDWGIVPDVDKHTRRARNRATFRFQEYFEICKKYYGVPGSEERSRFDAALTEAKKENPNIDVVYFLMSQVNEKMKQENPDLYYFYLPYIIPNREKIDYSNIFEDKKPFKPKKNMEFFRNFIVLDSQGELKIRERGAGNRLYPSADVYKMFIESDDSRSFTERLTEAVKELNDPKYRFDIIPQFGRNDAYTPKLTSLAHFHSALSNEKQDGSGGRLKSHSPTKGKGQSKQWYLNAAVQQDQGMSQKPQTGETRLSAMVYRLKFNADKIAEIAVTPYKWRTNVNMPLVMDLKTGETITYKSRQ